MNSKGVSDGFRDSQKDALKRLGYKAPGTRQCCGNCIMSEPEKNGQARCMLARPTTRVSKLGWCPRYTNVK